MLIFERSRKKIHMSKQITGFLVLENSHSGSFIPKNDVQFILGLNEGHDRPVWEWMLNGNNRTNSKMKEVQYR